MCRAPFYFVIVLIVPALLMSCAKSTEKPFKPIVTKIGSEVRAISSEEASTVCQKHYCERNQLYFSQFGRKKHKSPGPVPPPEPQKEPLPVPTVPGSYPAQPAEQMDYSHEILNAASAWALTEGSPEVVVAVIDSGVDYFHPDLMENIAINTSEARGVPGIDDDGDGYVDNLYGWDFYNDRANAYDDFGHGTHCAGTIAAAKNAIGVRGIAPKVKILPVKFLGANGGGDTADAVKAIDYAVAHGARILSNSWGGGGFSPLLDDAIQRALNRGAIFVAAAGNRGQNIDELPDYPSNYANVIAVGASDAFDERAYFSNYGAKSVQIFAPGSSILSTYPNGQYKVLSGTSMATPQVSGAFALALSLRPDSSRVQLVEELCQTSVGKLTGYSRCGRADVGSFVKRVSSR